MEGTEERACGNYCKVEKREEGRGMGMTIGYSNKRGGKGMRGICKDKIVLDCKKK
jgi:hypothetical protein